MAHFRIPSSLLLAATVALLGACDPETSTEEPRGVWQSQGKADSAGASCIGSCGGQAAAGCWCDDSCEDFGDCCPDIVAACETECPNLSSPPPDFCPEGSIEPVMDDAGICVVSFECIPCPNLTSPPPDFCPDGLIEPFVDPETSCVTGFTCEDCPKLDVPDVSACDSRVIEAVVEDACVVAYECYVPQCG